LDRPRRDSGIIRAWLESSETASILAVTAQDNAA